MSTDYQQIQDIIFNKMKKIQEEKFKIQLEGKIAPEWMTKSVTILNEISNEIMVWRLSQ